MITHLNQLKEIYFPKVREIVEQLSCQTNDAITAIRATKESIVFSMNLQSGNET